ncbi:MAG: arsenate reductase family protein [Candidatus Izemoplasmataceae bacterium]
MLFIEYPPCSTCKKAKKWLDQHHLTYKTRHIVDDTPTIDELTQWIKQSNLDIKKFFNTSGNVYKALNLKDKLDLMTFQEKIELLSSNGMLIKRPLLITDSHVFVGFKEKVYESLLKNEG